MTFWFLLLLAFAITVLLMLGGRYSVLRRRRKQGLIDGSKLIVGICAEYPPYEFIDENGDFVGFDIEYALEIAQRLRKNLSLRTMAFNALIPALKRVEIDVIISKFAMTPSRLAEIDMVPYLGKPIRSFALIFWQEIPQEIKVFEDLKNFGRAVVSVQQGTVLDDYVQRFGYIKPKQMHSLLGISTAIRHGQALAGLVIPHVAYRLQNESPKIKILEVPLDRSDWILGDGIGIRKGNTVLRKLIENVVTQIREQGHTEKMKEKWLS